MKAPHLSQAALRPLARCTGGHSLVLRRGLGSPPPPAVGEADCDFNLFGGPSIVDVNTRASFKKQNALFSFCGSCYLLLTYNSLLFLKVMLLKVKLSIYSTSDTAKQVSFLFVWECIFILNLLL